MGFEDSSNSRDIFTSDDVPPSDSNESTGTTTMRRFTADSTRTVTDASASTTPEELQIRYRVNGGPLRHYQIPFDRMPMQGLTRKIAFGTPRNTSFSSHALIDLMSTMEALNGRPLTQTEAEGVALHVGRKHLYTTAAVYGGIFGGALLAYWRRKNFKFPFRKPKPVERYDSFPLQRAPLLTGQYARIAWHATRGVAYIGVSWSVLIPLYDYMGRNAQAAHLMRDARTRDLTQQFGKSLHRAHREIQEDLKRKIGQSVRGAPGRQSADNSSSNQPDADSSAYGDYYGGSQSGYVQDDDNSPSSSRYPYSDTSSNTGVLGDAQMQSRTRSQRPSPSSSDPSNRNPFDLEKTGRQPRTFDSEYNSPRDSSSSPFFNDDDDGASPTAGNDPYLTPPSISSPSQSPSGSAWSRVRQSTNSSSSSPVDPTNKHGITPASMRQSSPQSASARQLQQKSASAEYETSPKGDSLSFSREGEERQRAKEMAQREFDRMLEAEREGEEGGGRGGEGGGGEGNYWGRRRRGS